MSANKRPGWLLFGFVSDILAIFVLPYTLAVLSFYWVGTLLTYFPLGKNHDLMGATWFMGCVVGAGLFLNGLSGNLQRDTPRKLLRYLLRAGGLTFGIEAAVVVIAFLTVRYYPPGYPSRLPITQSDILLGTYVLALLAYLWGCYALLVVPDPPTPLQERTLRGLQIEEGDDIENRAFRDR